MTKYWDFRSALLLLLSASLFGAVAGSGGFVFDLAFVSGAACFGAADFFAPRFGFPGPRASRASSSATGFVHGDRRRIGIAGQVALSLPS